MNPAVRLVQGNGKVLHEENSRTVLTVWGPSKEARTVNQFLAAFAATFGALCGGTFFAWSGTVEPLIKEISTETFSWIAACLPLGAFAGSMFAGAVANAFGRQRTLASLAPPMLLAWLLLLCVDSPLLLVLGRLLAGVAFGILSVVAGMYVSEIASPSVRGTLGAFFQLQITVGLLVGGLTGKLADPAHIAYAAMPLPVVFFGLIWFMPESPVFLLSRGQSERARASLQWLRGDQYDVAQEVASIRHSIMESQQSKASAKDLFTSRVATKGLVVALGLMGAQQLSGVNAVIFYTSKIFEKAGSTMSASDCSIVVFVVQVLATFLSMLLADRAGRRVLLLLSSSVLTVCLAMLAVYYHIQGSGHDMNGVTWLPLATVAVFFVMFSLGLGPLPWCVVSEVFSPSTKGPASSIACGANWLMAFTVTKFFPNLEALVQMSGAFFIFTAIAALGTAFIFLVVPETKGKTLEQILAELAGDKIYPSSSTPEAVDEEEEEREACKGKSPFPL